MDYIFSSVNPRIEPVYFAAAVMVAFFTAACTNQYRGQEKISKMRSVAVILLNVYIFLVFASTVFSRQSREYYSYELLPFWSYREVLKGSWGLLWENILNVFMLFPVGTLLPLAMKDGQGSPKRIIRRTVLAGFLISLAIESLQLFLKCGLFEFDDMFHNTIGTMLGYQFYRKVREFIVWDAW